MGKVQVKRRGGMHAIRVGHRDLLYLLTLWLLLSLRICQVPFLSFFKRKELCLRFSVIVRLWAWKSPIAFWSQVVLQCVKWNYQYYWKDCCDNMWMLCILWLHYCYCYYIIVTIMKYHRTHVFQNSFLKVIPYVYLPWQISPPIIFLCYSHAMHGFALKEHLVMLHTHLCIPN